jgi:DNA-directed RNA polymerase specialized sigma24 family protein
MSASSNLTATLPLPRVSREEGAMPWSDLYPRLRTICRQLVYSFHVPVWRGQEEDIIQDILQETARRIIERTKKVERGEATPFYAPERMVTTIAYNYCRDMRRHDQRLLRLPLREANALLFDPPSMADSSDIEETATESAYQDALFIQLAYDIAKFPCKQRQALLIDLANRMFFGLRLTSLQQAFLSVGIRLQDYQRPLPVNKQELQRYTALLYCAYRRIARLTALREYNVLI